MSDPYAYIEIKPTITKPAGAYLFFEPGIVIFREKLITITIDIIQKDIDIQLESVEHARLLKTTHKWYNC